MAEAAVGAAAGAEVEAAISRAEAWEWEGFDRRYYGDYERAAVAYDLAAVIWADAGHHEAAEEVAAKAANMRAKSNN